jgi:hypothetical protein
VLASWGGEGRLVPALPFFSSEGWGGLLRRGGCMKALAKVGSDPYYLTYYMDMGKKEKIFTIYNIEMLKGKKSRDVYDGNSNFFSAGPYFRIFGAFFFLINEKV